MWLKLVFCNSDQDAILRNIIGALVKEQSIVGSERKSEKFHKSAYTKLSLEKQGRQDISGKRDGLGSRFKSEFENHTHMWKYA